MYKPLILITLLLLNLPSFSQVNLDSLFASADSLTLIYEGIVPQEYSDDGFYQSFCHESGSNFSTGNKNLITSFYYSLSFKETSDMLFCGYDYWIIGFNENKKIFKIDFNSECNFASMGHYHFWTDSLKNFDGLKKFTLFKDALCQFRTPELLECYIESLSKDTRIKILTLKRQEDLEIFYRFITKQP